MALVEVDGVKVVKGLFPQVIAWHQDPYRVGIVAKTGPRRWQVVVYDNPMLQAPLRFYRFTRRGAVSKLAQEFAKVGVSILGALLEAEAADG